MVAFTAKSAAIAALLIGGLSTAAVRADMLIVLFVVCRYQEKRNCGFTDQPRLPANAGGNR